MTDLIESYVRDKEIEKKFRRNINFVFLVIYFYDQLCNIFSSNWEVLTRFNQIGGHKGSSHESLLLSLIPGSNKNVGNASVIILFNVNVDGSI